MRKILTQEELTKKEKRRNQIISIILLLIMVGSTAGFAFVYETGNSGKAKTGEKCSSLGDRWACDVSGQQIVLSSSPDTINSTSIVLLSALGQFSGKPLYIDTQNPAFYNEIYTTLGQYAQRVQYSCYSNCENSTFAQKTCSDNLIVIKPGNINKVYQNQSCVFIEGDMRAIDAFLYRTFNLP